MVIGNSSNTVNDNMTKKKSKPVNKYEKNKKLRDEGKAFENRKGELIESKSLKQNPCVPDKCNRKCFEINEEKRKTIHEFY